jgi:L-amino acid N-acyltransferase YncA
VKNIYQQGIDTGDATFETAAPGWEAWDDKFLRHPRLVALFNDEIAGWAALSQVSARAVYAGVCEVSIYIHMAYRARGIGKKLLAELVEQSEQKNIWTLQAGIFPENSGSIKLHKMCGFREVGTVKRSAK